MVLPGRRAAPVKRRRCPRSVQNLHQAWSLRWTASTPSVLSACSTAWRCRFLTARRCQHGQSVPRSIIGRTATGDLRTAHVTTCDASSQTASAVVDLLSMPTRRVQRHEGLALGRRVASIKSRVPLAVLVAEAHDDDVRIINESPRADQVQPRPLVVVVRPLLLISKNDGTAVVRVLVARVRRVDRHGQVARADAVADDLAPVQWISPRGRPSGAAIVGVAKPRAAVRRARCRRASMLLVLL